MPITEQRPPAPTRYERIQPCSEGCACFRPLAGGGWSDYGICTNPVSRFRGYPVRIGRDCRDYQPDEGKTRRN